MCPYSECMAVARNGEFSTYYGVSQMILDPLRATKDFLDGIVARKEASIYLPESASESSLFSSFTPTGRKVHCQGREGILLKILMLAGVRIPPWLAQIYQQIAVSRNKGVCLVKDLVNGGYLQVYQYHSC